MEKTIKAELEREIISTELLSENALLVVSKNKNENIPVVSVCYVEDSSIKEAKVAELTEKVEIEYNERIVAVFNQITCLGIPRRGIVSLFDLKYNEFVNTDFLRIAYNTRTNHGEEVKQLVYSSKN